MMAKAVSSVDNSQKKAVDLLHRIKGSPRTDSMPHLWPMTMLKTAFLTIVVMLVALLAGCAESGEKETEEASIIDKVVNEITINGISLSKTNHKIFDVIGGSRPYPWDLWKPRGICRYYLVEDLNTPLEDNYRDAIIGISLIFPCDEADRDYEKWQCKVESELHACIYVTVEGGESKLVKYKDQTIVDYKYPGEGWGYDYGLLYLEVENTTAVQLRWSPR